SRSLSPLLAFLSSRLLSHPSSTLFPYTTLFRSLLFLGQRLIEQFDAHRDRGQNVVQVVRDAAGQGADALQPLHAEELRFQPFLLDRKSTRLNSSHQIISYAVFCLKKKRRPRGRM